MPPARTYASSLHRGGDAHITARTPETKEARIGLLKFLIARRDMPWNNQTGGNGSGPVKGPWGRGPTGPSGGGGGNLPPNISNFLRDMQERIRRLLPNGEFTTGVIILIVVGA